MDVFIGNNVQNHQGQVTGSKQAEIWPMGWMESIIWRNSVSARIGPIGLFLRKEDKILLFLKKEAGSRESWWARYSCF
jgi:hypothetical protein